MTTATATKLCVSCRRPQGAPHADHCQVSAMEFLPGTAPDPDLWPYADPTADPDSGARRLQVKSESGPHWYEVTSTLNGPGFCACMDFEKRGRSDPDYRCKHLRWVDSAHLPETVSRVEKTPDGWLVDADSGAELAFVGVSDRGSLDAASASAVLAMVAELDAEERAINEREQAVRSQLDTFRDRIRKRRDRILSGARPALEAFAKSQVGDGKRQVWEDPAGNGKLRFTRRKGGLVVADEQKAVQWCEAFAPEALHWTVDRTKVDAAQIAGVPDCGFLVAPESVEFKLETGVKVRADKAESEE